MPCRSFYDPPTADEVAAEAANQAALRARTEEMGKELDLVTRLLCKTLHALESADSPIWSDPDLRRWWDQHKQLDKQRAAATPQL